MFLSEFRLKTSESARETALIPHYQATKKHKISRRIVTDALLQLTVNTSLKTQSLLSLNPVFNPPSVTK